MGHLARMLAIEEISRVYAPLGFYFETAHMGMYCIQNFGTEEQKKKYLPPLCRGDGVMAFAVTESSGGSDPTALQTTAELAGDEYVVNGKKFYITSGQAASVVCFRRQDGRQYQPLRSREGHPRLYHPPKARTAGTALIAHQRADIH